MVSVKNSSARLVVLFGVSCIPGQVTDLPVENNEEFKATIKGVEGLKVVKSSATKTKAVEVPELTLPEDENEDENEDAASSSENKPSGWDVKI